MQAYRWTAERVLRELNSAPGGLSRKQAAARLAKHGENRLARKKGDSLWRRFMLQLSDPMILVLLAAAAVSAVLCVVHREFPVHYTQHRRHGGRRQQHQDHRVG